MAALAVGVMVLGGVIPIASYSTPVLAAAMLVPVLEACGKRIAWAWYAAVAVLSCLLCPNVESAVLFLTMGYYPIVRQSLNKISLRILRVPAKLLVFNGAVLLMMGIMCLILGAQQLIKALLADGVWLIAGTLILANIVFMFTDLVLGRITILIHRGRK